MPTEPPLPPNEARRLAALREYHILDTAAEQAYDDLTAAAAFTCGMPLAMISLVDKSRQWFKSTFGIQHKQTPRDAALCARAILALEPLIIPDLLEHPLFRDFDPFDSDPRVRFYAGFPLVSPDGFVLGTLCVMDSKPGYLSDHQEQIMRILARQVMALMELRRVSACLAGALEKIRTLHGLLPICAWCKRIRDDAGYWTRAETYIREHTDTDFTHCICPDCLDKVSGEHPLEQLH